VSPRHNNVVHGRYPWKRLASKLGFVLNLKEIHNHVDHSVSQNRGIDYHKGGSAVPTKQHQPKAAVAATAGIQRIASLSPAGG